MYVDGNRAFGREGQMYQRDYNLSDKLQAPKSLRSCAENAQKGASMSGSECHHQWPGSACDGPGVGHTDLTLCFRA